MIKRLFVKLKKKLINFLKWIWAECKDWHTLLLLGIVAVVMSAPVWGCYILGFVFDWDWAHYVATAAWVVYLGPVPFWVICIAVTLAIKRLFEKKQEHDEKIHAQEIAQAQNKEVTENESADTSDDANKTNDNA